jgi:hypothetical protein
MAETSSLVVLAGIALVLTALYDAFVTVLHPDQDGPVASRLFVAVWSVFATAGGWLPRARRAILALAGPSMMVMIFVFWITTFTVGFALVYWPHLDSFWAEDGVRFETFLDALYFSGNATTVLGFGEIVPNATWVRMLTVVQGGLGFALVTGVVTFAINVISGLSDRNALTLSLWMDGDRSGDGANVLLRVLAYEGSDSLRHRLVRQVDTMQVLHQRMRQFPIIDLFYRSKNPLYAPEMLFKWSAELGIAAQILATDARYRSIVPSADALSHLASEMMGLIAAEYMDTTEQERLAKPRPVEDDITRVRQIYGRISGAIDEFDPDFDTVSERTFILAARTRIFLAALDQVTGWRSDVPHPDRHETSEIPDNKE